MNKLPYDFLLKYMKIVYDAEVNCYIQSESIKRLSKNYNSLGKQRYLNKPVRLMLPLDDIEKKNKPNYFAIMITTFFLVAMASLILSETLRKITNNNIILSICICVAVIFLIIFLTIKIGIAIDNHNRKKHIKERKEIRQLHEDKYAYEMNLYHSAVEADKRRVQRENETKALVRKRLYELERIYKDEKVRLAELYSYGFLAEKYRNIIAVSSMYEYLKVGRTRSLEINGGDKGAYNIYEEEVTMKLIVTSLNEILNKMDDIIDNQRELRNSLNQAERKIQTISNNFSNSLNLIKQNQEVSNYLQSRQTAAADYISFMNTLYLYK